MHPAAGVRAVPLLGSGEDILKTLNNRINRGYHPLEAEYLKRKMSGQRKIIIKETTGPVPLYRPNARKLSTSPKACYLAVAYLLRKS
jgi:hypothetical protein